METLVRADAAAQAVDLLQRGGLVALPTETVYGLAADATRAEAVVKIFEVKERPYFDPLIVHLPDIAWLDRVAGTPGPLAQRLIEKFWPGPFTLVLPRKEAIPDIAAAGLPTVALRMSAHPVFREVISHFGKPLAAPSANRFGRISPTCAQDVVAELGGRIPLVVDGGRTAHGLESTIVAVEGDSIKVLRSGPVTAEELAEFGPVIFAGHEEKPVAPGQLASHYAPRTALCFLKNFVARPGTRCGLLAWTPREAREPFVMVEQLSARQDLREAAARLFAAMRRLDEAGLDLIVAEEVPEAGLGLAIMDRLRRAASHE
jgi:L-threonylcarbamoyladenylate synthase